MSSKSSKVSVNRVRNLEAAAERSRSAAAAEARKVEDSKLSTVASPTYDSFQNFGAKVGIGTDNLSSGGTYGFNPITRERTLLEWMHRGSWVCGLGVDLIPDDMTRAGVELKGQLKPEEIEQIEELATSLNIWGNLRDNAAWGRLYGGSLAVHMVSGQDYQTPLRVDSIKKDQYKGMVVLDRWMVQPSLEDLVTEEGPHLGLPKFYYVTANAPGLRGKRIHYSRVIRAQGNKLPYWQAVQENLWTASILERPYDRIVAFDSTTQGAAQLVYKSYLRTYAIEGLREAIVLGGEAVAGMAGYVQMMSRFQSIEGITLIDAKDKFEQMQHGAFSGLAEILVHFGQQLSGGFGVPLVRLFGQSPAGLNSTGESDFRNYYDGINATQNRDYKVPVTITYRMLAASAGIKLDDAFGIKFRPLWQLDEVQKADHASKTVTTAAAAVEGGLMSPQTAMKEVRAAGAVNGFGTHITDEDIESASPIMPPTPVEVAQINAAAKEEVASEKEDAPATSPSGGKVAP